MITRRAAAEDARHAVAAVRGLVRGNSWRSAPSGRSAKSDARGTFIADGLWLPAGDGRDTVDRSVKRKHRVHASRFGLGDEIRLGEAKSVDLVDLERAQL